MQNITKISRMCAALLLGGVGVTLNSQADITPLNTPKASVTKSHGHTSYLRADAGYSLQASKPSAYYGKRFKGAVLGSVGMGYRFDKMFRSDFTVSYRGKYKYSNMAGTNKMSQDLDNISILLNAYLEMLPLLTQDTAGFGWHLMAGGGLSINKPGDYKANNVVSMYGLQTRNFAWNVGTGITYEILTGIYTNLAYKYIDLGKFETKHNNTVRKHKSKAHEASLGLIYNL